MRFTALSNSHRSIASPLTRATTGGIFAGIGLIAGAAPAGCPAPGAAGAAGVAVDAVEGDGAAAFRQDGSQSDAMTSSTNSFLMCRP
jgi:hypothetical protein